MMTKSAMLLVYASFALSKCEPAKKYTLKYMQKFTFFCQSFLVDAQLLPNEREK